VRVAAGELHSLGLKADGTVVAWGYDSSGECDVPAPNAGFVALAGGIRFSVGLKQDGTIVGWGDNTAGQCNDPTPNSDFVAVGAGPYVSLGLRGLPVAVTFSDVRAEAELDNVDLRWSVNLDRPSRLFVLRSAAEDGQYELVSGALEAGAGRADFIYRDTSVEPSTEYFYKIGCEEAGVWSYSSPVRVEIPAGLFALLGTTPNPSLGAVTVDFELPTAGHARLEVLDVRGRRVLLQDLSGLGTGRHVLQLGAQQRLPAGVYMVRLSQSGQVRTAKAVILR
jgi:hypothetical protein